MVGAQAEITATCVSNRDFLALAMSPISIGEVKRAPSPMPELPLDHPEPFAATLGVMLYPGVNDAEQREARAFAAHYLAEPVQRLLDSGRTLPSETLERLVVDGGERLIDLDRRWRGGLWTGDLVKVYFALASTNPKLASWRHAVDVVERAAVTARESGSRSALWEALRQFRGVAHLWAAWSIREGKFLLRPEVGYDGNADFQSFLTEAEMLLWWGQHFQPRRDKAWPPLPDNVWRAPEGWQPPERQPGWPDTGRIYALTLPDHLLIGLRPAGRPRKHG